MPADLQSAPFGRSGTPPDDVGNRFVFQRAGDGNRTHYLLITSQLLYQVSYASESQEHSFAVCLLAYLKGGFDRSKRRVSQGNSEDDGRLYFVSGTRKRWSFGLWRRLCGLRR